MIENGWVEQERQRENAAQIAATTLPRQGQNRSLISSLFRFGYYYSDYLIGQFVIQVKYVLRGYIVLYERYYFDFINDSRRSNIDLPEGIAACGFNFLLKPDLNFFLYASPQTILSRKQELDEPAIQHLTAAYLQLFQQLGEKAKGKYYPLENEVLSQTIDFILRKTIEKSA